MPNETIPQAHERLHYDHYEPALKSVKGLWAQLQKLKSNPAAYIAALERHVSTLRKREEAHAALPDDLLYTGWNEISTLWATLCLPLLASFEDRQPYGVIDWVTKWRPEVGAAFDKARTDWIERPSTASLAAMKKAIPALFAAYQEGF